MLKWVNKMLDRLDGLIIEENKHKRYIIKGFFIFIILFFIIVLIALFRFLIVVVLAVAIMYMLGWLAEEIKEISTQKENDKPQYKQQNKKTDKGKERK